MNSEFLKFVNRQANREVISPRTFALGGMLVALTTLYASHALAADDEKHARIEPTLGQSVAAAFHLQTGLVCPEPDVRVLAMDAPFYKIDLRCDLGDVYQHFTIRLLDGKAVIETGEVERK
jgi:hypothetical protein